MMAQPMETEMINAHMKSLALCAALVGAAIATGSPAEAGGRGKEFFSQTYTFDKPMHGYEGRAGDYYCSYVRIPVHKVDAKGRLKVVAWTLEQRCQ